jgi:hypothetical protein
MKSAARLLVIPMIREGASFPIKLIGPVGVAHRGSQNEGGDGGVVPESAYVGNSKKTWEPRVARTTTLVHGVDEQIGRSELVERGRISCISHCTLRQFLVWRPGNARRTW